MSTASSGAVAMIRALTVIVLKNSGRSAGWARMYRHPSGRSRTRSRAAPTRTGRGSLPPLARIPAAQTPTAESRKLAALASTVVTGPNNPNAAPPSGGPSAVAVQVVDSNRPLARSRSSPCTTALR
jgi:hypothetical protein